MSLQGRLDRLERMSDAYRGGPRMLLDLWDEHGHPTRGEDWTEEERAAASDVGWERCLETGLRVAGVTRDDARAWLKRHQTEGQPQ